jgi:ABC-type branched-subunit amino acid transport system substrate-binding protein
MPTVIFHPPTFSRRRALTATARLALGANLAVIGSFALAQPRKSSDGELVISQIADFSQAQQDVSKDYVVGARAAWQEINLRGGLRGRKVRHVSMEVDGSEAEVAAAVKSIRANAASSVIFGTASHTVAQAVNRLLRDDNITIAHAAPWLQLASDAADLQTFSIFAKRTDQIAYAIKNLTQLNVKEVGAVYASAAEFALFRDEVTQSAAAMQLKVQHVRSTGDLTALGQQLKLDSPAILLFLGGTPELAKFTQGLSKQARTRYCIAMADVNLLTLSQMGASKNTPVIGTQVVPIHTSSLPVVRAYRDTLNRLFDEPPTALSLAGYLAARFTFEVMSTVDDPFNRLAVLAAFQKSSNVDLGGYRVNSQKRSSYFVTQSMLSSDGRLVG